MDKKYHKYAQKIVKEFGEKQELEVVKIDDNGEEYSTGDTVKIIKIFNVFGQTRSAVASTYEEAESALVEYFSQQLSEGNILLSDTWEKDNLS